MPSKRFSSLLLIQFRETEARKKEDLEPAFHAEPKIPIFLRFKAFLFTFWYNMARKEETWCIK
jgi:hypothetical protein